jgi:hypothetical protein
MTAKIAANGDVTLTWTYSAYLTVSSGAYTVTTSSNGYGIVSVFGYQSFNLVNTYLKSEIDAFLAAKLPLANKHGFLGISSTNTAANGTQWLRANWTNYVSYIGDMSNGGYGVLCGTLQCNTNETLANPTTVDTIYGFMAVQSGSLRMNGHNTASSEDIWYGVSGNNTIILNNQGSRSYTQYCSNTFALPVQKKY